MKAKEYLLQISKIDRLVENKIAELEQELIRDIEKREAELAKYSSEYLNKIRRKPKEKLTKNINFGEYSPPSSFLFLSWIFEKKREKCYSIIIWKW